MLIIILSFAAGIGIVLGIAFSVIMVLYAAPFCLWLGVKQQSGKYKNVELNKISHIFRNATRVYSSWFSKKEPVLISVNKRTATTQTDTVYIYRNKYPLPPPSSFKG